MTWTLNSTLELVGFAVLGVGLAIPAILLNIRLAPKLGLIDWPKARGVAEDQIPLIGHSLVLLSIVFLAVLAQINGIRPWFLTTLVVVAVMGILDDRKPLASVDKFFFQTVCVCSIVLFDPYISSAITAQYGNWGTFWAIFFILGLTNGINFIDGIDGLAGTVIFVGALGLILFSPSKGVDPTQASFGAFTMGLMVTFLYFNVKRRQGFLGNVGSYFFAFCLAVMHLSIPMEATEPVSRVSVTGLAFLVPIADGVMVCILRILSLRSPLQADKGHLHHRLVQTSMPLRLILLNFGVISFGSMIVGLVLVSHPEALYGYIPFWICLSHAGISGMLIFLVERASRRRILYHFEKLDKGDPLFFLKYNFTRKDGSHISWFTLRRLELKVSAEIRIYDLCFRMQENNGLFIALRTDKSYLRNIRQRLDAIFRKEKVLATLTLEEGQFVKVEGSRHTARMGDNDPKSKKLPVSA